MDRDPTQLTEHPLVRDERGRLDLKSLSRPALERWLEAECGRGSRARAVYQWLWQKGATTFAEIADITKELRAQLDEVAYVHTLELAEARESEDGTLKYLWRLEDGHAVESVLIPEEQRLTLCISSQVGCAMGCTFCLTGDMGLVRQLKPSEIAGQVLQVGRASGRRPTNIVFMGMGEPLHNLAHVLTALEVILDDFGLNHSHRRVTVSTCGLVPRMADLAEHSPVNLAVSLNATTEDQRREIMPVSRRWSLAELMEASRAFPLPPGKRITFEYVMFRGLNDGLDDAERLYAMLRGVKAKVNLIPYNQNPDRPHLLRPDAAAVKAFQHYFVSRGLSCSIRSTRGDDIAAACGQLGRGAREADPPT